MNISKHSGTLLITTGVLHLCIVLVLYKEIYMQIISDGLFNTIGNNPTRAAAIWNLTVGIILILWGITLQQYQNKTKKPAPVSIGYGLLAFSVILCIIMPQSGAWLFLPQAIIILFAKRKDSVK